MQELQRRGKKGGKGHKSEKHRKTSGRELSHKLTVKGTLREVEDPRGESERQMEKGA